jgi:hypothetical protein
VNPARVVRPLVATLSVDPSLPPRARAQLSRIHQSAASPEQQDADALGWLVQCGQWSESDALAALRGHYHVVTADIRGHEYAGTQADTLAGFRRQFPLTLIDCHRCVPLLVEARTARLYLGMCNPADHMAARAVATATNRSVADIKRVGITWRGFLDARDWLHAGGSERLLLPIP